MAGKVKVKVNDGYAVFDGKQQVTSGTVEVDAEVADQLLTAGAVDGAPAARQSPARPAPKPKRSSR